MKILVLCTYPIKKPLHGGQLRVINIVDVYVNTGHEVEVAGVLGSDSYPAERGFESYPAAKHLAKLMPHPFMSDWAIGELYASNDVYFNALVTKISFTPDLIHVEQPWLFAFALRYKSIYASTSKLIYGSQNIEHQLKQAILSNFLAQNMVEKYSKLVELTELNAITSADGVICVSDNDLEWTRQFTTKPTQLASNGVSPWLADNTALNEARKISDINRFAFFCASAHPPNLEGFFDIFSQGFGSLTPDQSLVVAGGVSYSISSDYRLKKSAKLFERTVFAGYVSQSCLNGLLDTAHCIVLPLTQGGGTNLKTAEALWSGQYVIATSIAMRGFEKYIKSPGVFIADTPAAFKRKLREVMNLPKLQLSRIEMDKRRAVLWESTLGSLPDFIQLVGNNR